MSISTKVTPEVIDRIITTLTTQTQDIKDTLVDAGATMELYTNVKKADSEASRCLAQVMLSPEQKSKLMIIQLDIDNIAHYIKYIGRE